MIRISISQAAFDAIAKTLPFGNVSFENRRADKMKRQPLQAAWEIALGDLHRRHPELVDLESHRQAFKNAAVEVVARVHVRGLGAMPSNSASDEARVLAV